MCMCTRSCTSTDAVVKWYAEVPLSGSLERGVSYRTLDYNCSLCYSLYRRTTNALINFLGPFL